MIDSLLARPSLDPLLSERLRHHLPRLHELYGSLYGSGAYRKTAEASFEELFALIQSKFDERNSALKEMDRTQTGWYLEQDVVGITLYMDLFAGDIAGFKAQIPYLKELGVTFIHFMPLLATREGQNDGGYAVADYKNIQPRFGTTEGFVQLVEQLRENGIKSCVDFVVNHTAKEHPWALKAMEGDPWHQSLYMMYDTDEIPRAYEKTVPEVFPKVAPGNFTYYEEIQKWVFTSFYEFQWDLNFKNPAVFGKVVDILLHLANMGLGAIRLDAIPFMWKELGTTCRNLPQIHVLLEMMDLIVEIACPSLVLLGEAIVEPEEIVKYYGEEVPECRMMYNATHMVNLWNSLATRNTRLLQVDQSRFPLPSWACWINYIRCHDDIGWGFNEQAVWDMGQNPFDHKQFLIHFYEGKFPGSFSTGQLYEFNPETMDARNCGTLASLCGLEVSLREKSRYQQELALKRIQTVYAVLMASKGIPLIYSGDEIATLNDYSYLHDPTKSHDSRWLHRPFFDPDRAAKRKDPLAPEGVVFQSLAQLITLRKKEGVFHSGVPMTVIPLDNPGVYCFVRSSGTQDFVGFFNFTEDRQPFSPAPVLGHLLHAVGRPYSLADSKTDLLQGRTLSLSSPQIELGPYEFFWLL
ncbi:amylosucrase [Anaerotalea alkaliphila]|uniref:Alpha-amylase n=1 Tax=Anaerotalea alkaliphila TaxID=2662126 RepID=A0A7X5KL70_9FIRM|nr:amylosucrase [Anaerotalea alkaliphila]NDL66526.1 alpha-amylase [Anaerotalea alkaliphila]